MSRSLEAETRDSAREALADVQSILREYVVMGEAERTFLSLWCVHTFLLDHVRVTPYVAILSPTMRSGKTRLLEVLELLTCRGWLVSDVTPATVFRKVSDERVTLLLDEADCQLMGRQLRSLLNTGYRVTGRTIRLDRHGAPIEFSTYCAKVFAGIGSPLPPTVMDRSVPILVQRKLPTDHVSRFRYKDVEERAARSQAAFRMFERVFGERIADTEPPMPDGMSDRQRESLESFYVMADILRCRSALTKALTTILRPTRTLEPLSALLTDVRAAFHALRLDKVSTDALLATMRNLPRPVFDPSTILSSASFAQLVRPVGIGPRQLWINGHNVKGYDRQDFEDAWLRYC